MRNLFFLLLFFTVNCLATSGSIEIIEATDKFGVTINQEPYVVRSGVVYYPDSINLFYTCDPNNSHMLFKTEITVGDTIWFDFLFFNGFITAYFPEFLWNGAIWEPQYFPISSASTILSSPSKIYLSPNSPYLEVNYQNPSLNNVNIIIDTNSPYTRVMIVNNNGMVYYKNFNTQNFQINKNLPSGNYQIWIRTFYPNQCKPDFFYRYHLIVI